MPFVFSVGGGFLLLTCYERARGSNPSRRSGVGGLCLLLRKCRCENRLCNRRSGFDRLFMGSVTPLSVVWTFSGVEADAIGWDGFFTACESCELFCSVTFATANSLFMFPVGEC